MSRRSTVLTAAVAAVLALPAAAVSTAQAQEPRVAEQVPTELSALVADAAEEAAEQRQAVGAQAAARQRAAAQPEQSLDQAAEALVADGAVGVTASVESPDFQWQGSAGLRDRERSLPARPQDRFRVASITKTMVATLVLQEVEAGSFTLDTPVNELVPNLFPEHPDVTVEHLLSHRSGAQTGTDWLLLSRIEDPSSWEDFFDALGQDYTDAEHLAVVNSVPWLFEPGTGYSYSNAGYVALGVVLERVTGRDLADLLRERVFEPARMRHSSFPDEPGTRGPFLVGAAWTGEASEGGLGWVSLEGFDPEVFSAAGAAVSTTRDLNAFTESLVTGRLLDQDTVADMATPRTTDPLEYGLGIFRVPDPCTAPGEPVQWVYGHDGGAYGTISLALTSADGTRQLSLGVTGRDLTQALPAYDLDELLVPMILATC